MPFFLSNSLLDQEHGGSALSLYDLGWTEVDQEEAWTRPLEGEIKCPVHWALWDPKGLPRAEALTSAKFPLAPYLLYWGAGFSREKWPIVGKTGSCQNWVLNFLEHSCTI